MTQDLRPFVSTRFYVPETWVPRDVREIELTVHPIQKDPDRPPKEPIVLYDVDSYPGMIGLPIDWGVRTYGMRRGVEIIDRTVQGQPLYAPKRPDPNHPSVLDPIAQAQFMRDMLSAVADDFAVTAVAATGSGKTVVGGNTAAELGRSTLVICHLERIAKQWREMAINILGLSPDDVGIVQGPKCQYDRPFCVSLVQSLTRRTYPREFYHAFGTVIWDELHRYGTANAAETFFMFPAAVKIGMTATDKRKDGAEEAYLKHFGRGQVISTARALPCKVHVLRYTTRSQVWGEDMETVKLCVSRDAMRNDKLAAILKMLHGHNRVTLGIGDRIEHIEGIKQRLIDMGVPENHIGQYTSEFTNPDGVREKTNSEYLDWVSQHARIVLATYGMMKEGIDIPRLDAGVDLMPIGEATQVLGRIRRPLPGKALPLWYTLYDTAVGPFIGLFKSRSRDYDNDPNIEVVTHNGKTEDAYR